jgi:hypothetical protein
MIKWIHHINAINHKKGSDDGMKKRVLSGFLTLCMLLAVLPGLAWADAPERDTQAKTGSQTATNS